MGTRLPLAVPLFRVGAGLGSCWCRALRLSDKPADCALLHAGTGYDGHAWPCGPVWRIRHVGLGIRALLPAWPHQPSHVEREAALHLVLVPQHRAGYDDVPFALATGPLANLRLVQRSLRCSTFARTLAPPAHGGTCLGTGAR